MSDFIMEKHSTPIRGHYDVIVCGAGPAGVCAAISAANQGSKVLLIERGGCLGGIWTGGLLSWILDSADKGGILRRIISTLEERGKGYHARSNNFIAEPEAVKLLLEEMCLEAGGEIMLYTLVCGAHVEDGRLKAVICEEKGGRWAAAADAFVDATGDGDLSYFAGCGYDLGKEGTGETQPMSLIALVDGVDPDAARVFNNTLPYMENHNAKKSLLSEMRSAGIDPSYDHPSLFHVKDGLWLMMTTHAYGYDLLDASSLTKATMLLRREMAEQIEALRSKGGIWANMRMLQSAPFIGVREGRRIHGRYRVTADDVINGARFPDAVCRVNFPIDIHPLKRENTFEQEKGGLKARPYDIPLRALIARDVEGLYLAGRLISGDFWAHSSYRVTGNAAVLGEAAGKAAALKLG
ncbi:MAG: FAD-dependent oxidoreductase [Clostridiales bacterium]|nr:FAD-dependent oxidoreductase [Clostridiales bacterium]